ncbi:MAG TPA: hypothetical protein PKM03_13105 [Cyclobacteriaceae bacterium]|nr:hypothetical protein [Cyclobacteriaceae bacterium]
MKIAIIQKKYESAVSYYRASVPFLSLRRNYSDIMSFLIPATGFTDDTSAGYDILFLHRPVLNEELRCIQIAKECGVGVWVDVDDLLWKIPFTNEAYLNWSRYAQQNLFSAMINADVITTSTQALADEIKIEYGRESVVIPNAWDDRQGKNREFDRSPGKTRMVYRGSNTHAGDLYTHRDAFYQFKNIEFSSLGALPWFFHKQYGGNMDTIFHESATETILQYFSRLWEINPHYLVFPLEPNRFNECKSNIAFIEATMYAGAVCIAPDYMPEFSRVPCLKYKNVANLKDILYSIDIGETFGAADIHREAVSCVREMLSLSKVNETRVAICNFLMESK